MLSYNFIMTNLKAFQDYYPEAFGHCFGCGAENPHGLHIKSYWNDDANDATIAFYTPQPYHTGGYPGYVYGGLIAAILDCHGNGTAAAAGYRFHGRAMGSLPALRYITASLQLDYLKPTPMGMTLELHARILEVTARKVRMELWLTAAGVVTVKAQMVSVALPPSP